MRRLARTGWPKHEGMAQVTHVQVEAEWRRATGHAVHQRWRQRWVERAGRLGAAGPDAAGGQQIGQVQGVDQRATHVLYAVAGQATQVGVEGVDSLDTCGKAQSLDGLFDTARRLFQACAVFAHEDHHAGVVTLCDQAAVDLGDRIGCVLHHGQRILIDVAVIGVEHLVEEAADFLFPLLAVLFQVLHRFMGVHEDETAGPTVLARQLGQRGKNARRRLQRKTFDGDHLDEITTDLWHHAAPQFLPADYSVEVHRVARQQHRLA
ncbi:hypothetical protein D3C76_1116900 [compost metagenome]